MHNAYIDATSVYRKNFKDKKNNILTLRMMNALSLVNNGGQIIESIRRDLHEFIMHLPDDLPPFRGLISEKPTDWRIQHDKRFT